MTTRTVVVGSEVGLHARPAATFTQAVQATGVPVRISVGGGEPVDAASVLAVMTLGAAHGAEVTLHADDEAVLDQLAALIATDLDAA
ncbi:HPr family phosphocarrier protein [Nocardia asteroides NBRC 15531]|uniref:Phosphocarrier protein HPr n=1 Tax=Nocardia asteroides NBRC 15531 TaxID=1110697 RepID=U5ECR2_NOCAS|nr:HPr family phosphocarrier protein [Nocardia asteroides]TLF63709.1 HPr family phosphocarrier protein [Nocardia asteroides NBRC 15531]UGT46825.1 HPr family phosphocarrier protein [Nocardia asteroides]SFM87384.1 Phosphocarrier protein HPr [Nocardia asteroides]VEG34323.1 Phosphocarrier protein HPr [Nocardia asteroides]GAD84233.1 phosphocarrier protein HPr [Nocardia asteroides NBRC 15531]